MDFKKIRKSTARFFAWAGFNLCSLIIKFIPARRLYGFADTIASLGYAIASKQRNIAIESLGIAFGSEKNEEERKQIARECFVCMAKSAVELMFFVDKPYLLRKQIALSGKENLDAALSNGKGVILVSAHFGNFPLLLGRLSLDGYKVAGIMHAMRDQRMERIFLKQRNRFNVKTIYSQPRKACVDETIRSLRNNEVLFIPIDQNFGTGGVFVNFFGRKAATATGPVVLSQRTKAEVLPCFIIREKDDTHKIIFEKPLSLGEEKGEEAVIEKTQKITGIIESYIRKYPAQWGWIHRRWKSRPSTREGGV